MKKALALLVLVACAFPVVALAQDPPGGRARRDEVDRVTSYEFTDGSSVTGGRYNPEQIGIEARRRSRRDTLVHPRTHYVNEMLKSVENL